MTEAIWTCHVRVSFSWCETLTECRLFANELFVGCVYEDLDEDAPGAWVVMVSGPEGGDAEGHFKDRQEARDYLLDWGIRNATRQTG